MLSCLILFWCMATTVDGYIQTSGRNLKQHLQSPPLSEEEQVRMSMVGCNPLTSPTGECVQSPDKVTPLPSEENIIPEGEPVCDDISPSQDLGCAFYVSIESCNALKSQYCRESCGRCCFDVEVPGLTCDIIVDIGACNSSEIMNQKYCERSCGMCSTSIVTPVQTPVQMPESPLEQDKEEIFNILYAFRESMSDPSVFLDWSGNDPCGSEWSGLNCSKGQIISLYIDSAIFTSIPPEFSMLTSLRYLDLEEVKLTGTIPPELSNLKELEEVHLDNNQLEGTLPEELSECDQLYKVYLQKQDLQGTIPSEYSMWAQIEVFKIENNLINGTLPSELSTWSNMNELSVEYNSLEGQVPIEYSEMKMEGGKYYFFPQYEIEYVSYSYQYGYDYKYQLDSSDNTDFCIPSGVEKFLQVQESVTIC
eukprot:TRINITY_DN2387_c0_g1_i1.p1 TRINITY_DN2387_c0_g1~~TRINITY_DN2387_c0_g1_i1.p1  ORF type:complete len:421 (-),score=22.70 TRINITY_DN2387_c0_g1_i1:476-1738(-)